MKITVTVLGLIGICAQASAGHGVAVAGRGPGKLTGEQILNLSSKAYRSVKSFEEDIYGSIGSSKATAHVVFQRPGKLRVTGQTMFSSPYDLVINGGTCWVLNAGSWSKAESPQMGVAMITGISANSGSTVPAALLELQFGPLKGLQKAKSTVSTDVIGGSRAYKLTFTDPFPTTLWIDAKTFFLLKSSTKLMGREMVVVCKPPTVNRPVPASSFLKR